MAAGMTDFGAAEHGFRFRNRFEFSLLSEFQLPIGGKTLGSIVYGLCGGMCFAALDYFYAGIPVPDTESVDDLNLEFFNYLWERQMDSLELDTLGKVLKWMLYSDRTVSIRTANQEAPRLRALIDTGDPVVLALVRVAGLNDPTKNHQALATGYDFDTISGEMTVQFYDPNYPGHSHNSFLNVTKPSTGIGGIQDSGELFRGFFVIDYERQNPI